MNLGLRKSLVAAGLGSAVVLGLISLVAPTVINVLFTPPVSFGTHCEPAVQWALNQFRTTQLVGLVVGALLGPLVLRAWNQRGAQSQSPSP